MLILMDKKIFSGLRLNCYVFPNLLFPCLFAMPWVFCDCIKSSASAVVKDGMLLTFRFLSVLIVNVRNIATVPEAKITFMKHVFF